MRSARFQAKLLLVLVVGALLWWWKFFENQPSPSIGLYERMASKLNARASEPCDFAAQKKRLGLSQVIDRYRPELASLWVAQAGSDFPSVKMISVGPIFLRLNQPAEKEKNGFDITNWGWEEAFAKYLQIQQSPMAPESNQRWRDLDTAVRFLLEKDAARAFLGEKFLSPEKTTHHFVPRESVFRKSQSVFVVRLSAGDFHGAEAAMQKIFEGIWRSPQFRLEVEWVKNDPSAYRLVAHKESGRSFVDHSKKEMLIANFAWKSTVAHELGHILGFDDHYYNVWHQENCYYSQEARLSDIMSSSEKGRVTPEHWKLLDRAYPWRASKAKDFYYHFGS